MPRYFGVAFYNVSVNGWSEVYPISAASYTAAGAILDGINTARLALAAQDVVLQSLRVSDTDILRDSFFQSPTTHQGTFSGTPNSSGDPDDTYRELVEAGQLKRGMRQLHALPGSLFVAGIFTPNTVWTTALTAWENQLITNVSIATKIRGAMAPPFYTFSSITAVARRGDGNRKVGRPFGTPRGRRSIV